MSFKIIDLDISAIPSVIDIADKQLGEGYITQETLTVSPTETTTITRVAVFKNIVLGFSICEIMPPSHIEKVIRTAASPNSLFGLLKTVAVRRDSVGFGVGGELARDGVLLLKDKVDKIYAVGSQCKKGVNSNSILNMAGFKKKYKIPDYWREESLEKNYNCRDCGSPPCKCAAVIFVHTLH